MGSIWFTSTFFNFFKLPQVKEGRPNFLVGTNSAERLNYLVPPPILYFYSRNLKHPNSWSFIRYQWVLHDSPVLFTIFSNCFKLKRGDLISWWEPILQKGWIIWSYLLYSNFRNLKHSNSLSFIRFQWVLHDSPVLVSIFWNFFKLKRGDLISCVEPILQNARIIWIHFCISIPEIWNIQILCHSLHFNGFQLIHQCICQIFEISSN